MPAAGGVADLVPHDHFCFVYDRDADARRAVLDYAVAGFARRERVCVLTAHDAAVAEIGSDLRVAGLPVDDLVDGGVLVFGSASEAFLAGGVFEPDARLDACADAARSAVADGHTGLRVYAETHFLADHPDVLAVWPVYELRADLLLKQIPMTAVCAYDARRWASGNLMLAETLHTRRSRDQGFSLHAGRDGMLRLAGDIDNVVADQVHRLLVETAEARATGVLDVSGVTFVDVSGARGIGMACEVIAGRHGPTTVRGATPLLRKIWRQSNWSDFFPNVILKD
ncbi:MEDS domain-containing protein [Paractinoplanes globisporus]|uniref:MEDS domain-containing protein n=1 Tax=Paractinoplanes globisporus TaxID=113565 RepID=A0ABW6WGP8_9ACTN|nr:MEDS domain-containing protein [Actinoplanes globisporus]